MTTTTETKKLTPIHECSERAIEMMSGKAICSYANWHSVKDDEDQLRTLYGDMAVEKSLTAHMSEYEATVRCIAMLVREHLPEVCAHIINQAKAEFGI